MSVVVDEYKLLKDLPGYPAGTVVCHQYENTDSFVSQGDWYTQDKRGAITLPAWLQGLVKWCATAGNPEYHGWVERVKQ